MSILWKVSLLVVLLAGPVAADDEVTAAYDAAEAARVRLRQVSTAIKYVNEATSRDELRSLISELRAVQEEAALSASLLATKLGRPHYTIEITNRRWKPTYIWKLVPVRARMAGITSKRVKRRDGGWLTLRAKLTAKNLPRDATAAKLLISVNGLGGFQHEYHWKASKRPVREGDTINTDLVVRATERQMAGFWIKEAASPQITKQTRVEPQWVVYSDGEKWGR